MASQFLIFSASLLLGAGPALLAWAPMAKLSVLLSSGPPLLERRAPGASVPVAGPDRQALSSPLNDISAPHRCNRRFDPVHQPASSRRGTR